ncbi:DUF2243 domain-containing protein [Magnetospirillum sp. UT-4]|uniref:DUF2243 domain-containing protein n=1 Tax=Magnetospirillum sp. UT-4 TaxID=2681467 RepID=UPI00137E9F64
MPSRLLAWSSVLLGFALGGFFDGILLHQILQWHHLLSGLESGGFARIEGQILADGLFHLLMYAVAAVGLALLWLARDEFAQAGRGVFALLLMGFGGWHGLDAVVSHWLLGIHRIRMDTEVPLAYDLAWVAVFGLLPFLAGAWLLRRVRADAAAPF